MFINRASMAAFAALALVLGTQGASKADGYASASGYLWLNGQTATVNVSSRQIGSFSSGSVYITSSQFHFSGSVSSISWSTLATTKAHADIRTAPFWFDQWIGSLLVHVPAYAVINMTGSGPGATVGFHVYDMN